jgi:hypothetical protein
MPELKSLPLSSERAHWAGQPLTVGISPPASVHSACTPVAFVPTALPPRLGTVVPGVSAAAP